MLGGGRCAAVFNLRCPGGPPELPRENYGFSPANLHRIARQVRRHLGNLYRAWRGIHGDH